MLIALCAACGSEAEEDAAVFDMDGDCLNCGVEGDPGPALASVRPPRTVTVEPESLEFYFEAQSGTPTLAGKEFVVLNRSDFDATLLAAAVIDDASAPGDSAYFEVEMPRLNALPAGHGELRFLTSFSGSTRRRVARVVVQTDHPTVSQIIVPVSGKVFVDATW